jgi:DNA-binding transcriptional MerR regulator
MSQINPIVHDDIDIPAKRYFTIGEVAQLCDLKAHVLRYWEQEFPQLAPVKRRGNRRYYQREDVILIRQIRELLYAQGFTIQGARQQLEKKPKVITEAPKPSLSVTSSETAFTTEAAAPPLNQPVELPPTKTQIQAIRLQLQTARALLKH